MAVSFHTEECTFLPQGRRRITAWIKEVITAEGYSPGDIAYIFCSPEYHIGINRQYLGHDYHTDVITFDYSDLNGTRNISGDIFIDPYTVRSNAETIGTQPQDDAGHHTRRTAPLRPWRQNPGGGAGHACIGGPQLGRIPSGERRLSSVRTAGPVRERPPKGKKYHRHGKGLFPPFQAHSIHRRTSPADPSFQREKPFYGSRRVCLRQPCIFSAERLTTNGQGREGTSAHRTAT